MERVATVNSEDSYGAAGMAQFRKFAGLRSMSILASTSFANGQEDLSSSVDALLSSGALVVVLFCQSDDASRFINAVQAAGGLNITWVGSEAVTSSVQDMVASSPQQAARLRGFAGLTLAGGVGETYTDFQARLGAFQATVLGDGWCSNATDDDGRRLWMTADGICIWPDGNATLDFYAPFAYDAVYTMARAANETLGAGADASLDGAALMLALLNTSFAGTSGQVAFDRNGDRHEGIAYDVYSVVGAAYSLLGQWRQGAAWDERFVPEPMASYVAVDGSSRVPELASSALLLPLGVLCKDSNSPSKSLRQRCDHVKHVIDCINDKADGWFDDLLPNHTIVTALRSVGCGEVDGRAREGWLELQASLPRFTAAVGVPCSSNVADIGGRDWRDGDGGRAVVVSASSTAPRSRAHLLPARLSARDHGPISP